MNVERARARRADIVEEQSRLADKHRMGEADKRSFNEKQAEFDKLTAEINAHEAKHGPSPEPILPMPAGSAMGGSSGFSSRMAGMDPVARQWVGAVLERKRAAGGETRALTLSGDISVDVPPLRSG